MVVPNHQSPIPNPQSPDTKGIAIIGMSCRFPGASNVEEFWQNLCQGVESIDFFSDDELLAAGVDPAAISHPNYVKASATLPDIDLFAAEFFGFTPKEAALMDPQHRIFLECAWAALEDAGCDPTRESLRIGTYAGTGWNSYLLSNLSTHQDLFAASSSGYQTLLGNEKDFLTTRVSYLLDLKGASVSVQTACSTSLVAVTMACQSLLSYQCDVALAGGISISVPQQAGYFYEEGGILSPDGHCRSFDAQAQGTVPGSGAGIVVLKRLEDALADGDRIDAVIKGTAINNDGALKVGYTAPSVEGQAEVIAEALAFAEIEPQTISYVETHGTGTALGDPIEIAALSLVFSESTAKKQFCTIGSVKTNVGHLDAAAGVAGLIKAVLSLKHRAIPPSLHFSHPNPQIDFANSPFYVNDKLAHWKKDKYPRRAAVSSFGIGGTNAHLVLEEAPVRKKSGCQGLGCRNGEMGCCKSTRSHVLVLSAKTEFALDAATANLANYLQKHPDLDLGDVAYTLQVGRRGFDYRRMWVCDRLEDTIAALESPKETSVARLQPIVFVFPGQGTQYVNMGQEIYFSEPLFREIVDICADLLQPHLGLDLRQILYPNPENLENAREKLLQTALGQPVLFVIEYALARLWISWGVRPQAAIGHSIGEYVAACLAGVFSLEEALKLVAIRGKLMQAQPAGVMLSVALSEADLKPYLTSEISLAAANAPQLSVVSGTKEAISGLESQLTSRGVACRLLHTSHAFHSPMMDGAIAEFIAEVRKVNLKAPEIPIISNLTGDWMTATEATDPSYWGRQLRQTVRFSDGIGKIASEGGKIWLEVGAGTTLSTFIKQKLSETPSPILSSLPHPRESRSPRQFLWETLGKLWLTGLEIDWKAVSSQEKHYRVALPTYPFERQRYWIDPIVGAQSLAPVQIDKSVKKRDINDWFYVPVWKQAINPSLNRSSISERFCWLIFADRCQIGEEMGRRLEELDRETIAVRSGSEYRQLSDREYIIDPRRAEDYERLLQQLQISGKVPDAIAHLWSVTAGNQLDLESLQDLGFYSLLLLMQALGKVNFSSPLQIGAVTNALHDITGGEDLAPEKATVLGACRVINREYPQINCKSIDIVLPSSPSGLEQLISQLIGEIETYSTDVTVAFRDRHRWLQSFEPIQLVKRDSNLRDAGVYLITGGLGGIGLTIAEYLAKTVRAKLVLISRSLDQEKASQIDKLKALGAEVLVIAADVTNLTQMQQAIAQTLSKFGTIHGVIHAAGVPGGGMIQLKTPEIASQVLAPKVKGTLVLTEVLQAINLDFCLLCSSSTAILGEFGQSDYAAANAFLDAFSHAYADKFNGNLITINWDAWQEVGMAANSQLANNSETAISNVEGLEIFERVINCQIPQIVVSTQDLELAIAQSPEILKLAPNAKQKLVRETYLAPSNEIEKQVADIWQELLGVEAIGVQDNFLEVGGHSLLAVQTISRIREAFSVDISLHTFLTEGQTVEKLALLIQQQQSDLDANPEIEELLAEIVALSNQKI
ncbi:beta-ketoacyl synthase [Merismopedia glauca CCAP 1448/3]|uniref:Phenolphthiocerol/phthiocerol polyketide synthase subunit E n=2 Tax=Merismopedia TaxID=53402 RepID=A0A2T1BZC7_9CYAN|nr:beta-ketoacyl synthase [Merismopedia glauca CCAP 1448/3]